MRLGDLFAAIREKLRNLDNDIAEAEALIEQKLHEKHTGWVAPPATRGDVRVGGADRRQRKN